MQQLRCPIDGRALIQRPESSSHVAWCRRCGGVWLPTGVAAPLARVLSTSVWLEPTPSAVLDVHRCPQDGARLLVLEDHPGKLELCEACSGYWLSGGLLRDYRYRLAQEGSTNAQSDPDHVGAADVITPVTDLVGLISSADASAADIMQAAAEILGNT